MDHKPLVVDMLRGMITKAMRSYLRQVGKRGGEAGTRESKLRGGETEAEQRAYYTRISRVGVRARAKARRGRNTEK